jgi:hypothetical protein
MKVQLGDRVRVTLCGETVRGEVVDIDVIYDAGGVFTYFTIERLNGMQTVLQVTKELFTQNEFKVTFRDRV